MLAYAGAVKTGYSSLSSGEKRLWCNVTLQRAWKQNLAEWLRFLQILQSAGSEDKCDFDKRSQMGVSMFDFSSFSNYSIKPIQDIPN